MNMKALLEGLLFAVGEEGLTIEKLEEVMELESEDLKKVICELKEDYARHKPKKERHVSRYVVKPNEDSEKKNKR